MEQNTFDKKHMGQVVEGYVIDYSNKFHLFPNIFLLAQRTFSFQFLSSVIQGNTTIFRQYSPQNLAQSRCFG